MSGSEGRLRAIFGSRGSLGATHGGFEHRPGQMQMALAVARAFSEGSGLVVEAGTGTGKSLAYLVPALLDDGVAILSTGTKALQDQLLEREVPAALEVSGRQREVVLLKGRENYLCLKRFEEVQAQPLLSGLEQLDQFRVIEQWAGRTGSGDRAEVPGLPDRSAVWSLLDARAETCTGIACEHYDRCHLVVARRMAQQAEVVVANHHLLFADLALRLAGEGQVLPDAANLVLDEAHLAPGAAASHFGLRLSLLMVVDLARDAKKELLLAERDDLPASQLERVARDLFGALRPAKGIARQRLEPRRLEELAAEVETLLEAWADLGQAIGGPGRRGDERSLIAARCGDQASRLERLTSGEVLDQVVTVEPQGRRGASIASWPIEVGPMLRESLPGAFGSVVATSATLAVARSLDRVAASLGLPDARKLIVDSPFDHRSQAALYLPKEFPEPGSAEFGRRSLEEIERLLSISEGRALVLFASHRALEAAAERLAGRLPWPILVQGRAPRELLVERFREEIHSVLLGTASFRQGIDVPGEALSLVIVDKLPFAVPDDPLVAARGEAIRRRGGVPFLEDSLPEAIISLKQALGRLIRSRRDRGLLALLDVRVRTRRYGEAVLASLPPWPILGRLEEARRWYLGRP